MTQPKRDYSRLKLLLEAQESFPLEFTLKFIGRKSAAFVAGVKSFEESNPSLRCQSRRESAKGNHLALTYLLLAQNANEILVALESISDIPDVQVIL